MQILQRIFTLALLYVLLHISGYAQQWQFRTPMPTARKGMAVAIFDNKIWVMGGLQTEHNALGVVEVYNPATNSWDSQLPDLTHARENATAQMWNGKIYIFGGRDNFQLISSVECYDSSSGDWQIVSNVPTPRFGMASVVVDSSIWLIGGTNMNNTNYDLIEIYHPQSNSWTTLSATLNIARGAPMTAEIEGNVYVFGGNFYGPIASFEKYDKIAQNWTIIGNMLYSCGGAGYVSLGNQTWLIGGMSQSGILNRVQIFSYVGGLPQWTEGPPLNTPRRELVTATVNDKIYAIGGRGMMGMSTYNTVEELDVVVGIANSDPIVPENHILISSYPNPFNNSTVIYLQIPEKDEIQLKIYDLLGHEVRQIYQGNLPAGTHEFTFSMENVSRSSLSSGIYLIRLEGRKFSKTKKINYIR